MTLPISAAAFAPPFRVRVQEPVFESQTKTKLGSQTVYEGGPSMKNFIGDFLGERTG